MTLDGEEVDAQHNGKDLVVNAPVKADQKYALVVTYSGTPEPAQAPTTRTDFTTTGWTVDDDGEVWTMQEPYGAYTWYPVNDQPSDKAFYDFTITAPGDWVGVANGQLQSPGDGRRQHRHRVEPRRPRVVVPHHDRDRRHGEDRGRERAAACR